MTNIRWSSDPAFASSVWKAWPAMEPELAKRYGPAKVTPEALAYHSGPEGYDLDAGQTRGRKPKAVPNGNCTACDERPIVYVTKGLCQACYMRARRRTPKAVAA